MQSHTCCQLPRQCTTAFHRLRPPAASPALCAPERRAFTALATVNFKLGVDNWSAAKTQHRIRGKAQQHVSARRRVFGCLANMLFCPQEWGGVAAAPAGTKCDALAGTAAPALAFFRRILSWSGPAQQARQLPASPRVSRLRWAAGRSAALGKALARCRRPPAAARRLAALRGQRQRRTPPAAAPRLRHRRRSCLRSVSRRSQRRRRRAAPWLRPGRGRQPQGPAGHRQRARRHRGHRGQRSRGRGPRHGRHGHGPRHGRGPRRARRARGHGPRRGHRGSRCQTAMEG